MKKYKILVVDDNHDICTLVESLLTAEGYTVVCCVNPVIAEEMIKKEKPQLVITDMLMSGVDGRTLIKNLRENSAFKDIKVILMSAHPEALANNLESGADICIAKPFDIDELTGKVSTLLA